jgi:NADPH:quinone reductase-like Zn-dependent oxidoreductase
MTIFARVEKTFHIFQSTQKSKSERDFSSRSSTPWREIIANKVVVITGASSGIGEAIAKLLASKGATVALAARRLDKLQRVAAEILAKGGKVSVHQVDVTDQEQVIRLVCEVACRRLQLDKRNLSLVDCRRVQR